MTTKNKIEFFQQDLDRQLKTYEYYQSNNKRKAFILKMIATAFGLLTTVLLGFQLANNTPENTTLIIKNVALVTSAIVTFFNAVDAFFNHKALWIRYTTTLSQLAVIKTQLDYLMAGSGQAPKEQDIDQLFERYRSILDETNTSWMELRKGADPNTPA
jgi:uncharacterized protein DUF4231